MLRTVAAPVRAFDAALAREAARLADILASVGGAGLAAPQAARLSRLIVVRMPGSETIDALANPAVLESSEETEWFTEGCLSMPDLYVDVERPAKVTVTAFDLTGQEITITAEGPASSLLQHEIDHLDAILLPDRLTGAPKRHYLRAITTAASTGWPEPEPAE